jgi:hypothetical protein
MIITEIVSHHSSDEPYLYISDQKPIEYQCDGKEGFIHFDGYYYIEDHAPPYPEDDNMKVWERPRRWEHWLPKKVHLTVIQREDKPYTQENSETNTTTEHYKLIENQTYLVEIYKRDIHECTDRISKDVDLDGDGDLVDVCFFPTNRQTVYFRVLETLQ